METVTLIISIITSIILLAVVTIVIILYLQIRKNQGSGGNLPLVLQNIVQTMQQEQTQVAVLNEKLTHIEPITQTASDLLVNLRGLSERITTVESNQAVVYQGVSNLANNAVSSFSELKTLTNNLSESTASIRNEITRAKNDLTELHAHAKTEQETERQIADSIRRLETVIAGTQSKGSAGENILEVVFSKLPIEWRARDFKIGGKAVEFALKLPNNLIMPIDCKWTATNLLEEFIASEDINEQRRLKVLIEKAVLQKAKEVKKYIDPNITVNFGVAVIPDAIYDLCAGIQCDVFQLNIVLVSYSMFIPYLLLVFQTMLKSTHSLDIHKLETYLKTISENVAALQNELDTRFSTAITMLDNSKGDMKVYISNIGGSLTGLQTGTGEAKTELSETVIPELKSSNTET